MCSTGGRREQRSRWKRPRGHELDTAPGMPFSASGDTEGVLCSFQQQNPCVKPDLTQNLRHKPGGNRVAQIEGKEEMEPDPPTCPNP